MVAFDKLRPRVWEPETLPALRAEQYEPYNLLVQSWDLDRDLDFSECRFSLPLPVPEPVEGPPVDKWHAPYGLQPKKIDDALTVQEQVRIEKV